MESFIAQQAQSSASRKFMTRVYGWMFLALVISGIAALFTATNEHLLRLIFGTRFGFIVLIVGELALVWYLSANIRNLSPVAATTTFFAYSVLNGMSLASIFFVYPIGNIVNVFFVTALMFGAMTIYGMITKTDISSFSRYFSMALIGLVIASVVNLLLKSSGLDWLISIAGVVLFTALTAWDTQKVVRSARYATDSDAYKNVAIFAALNLYLDFINIFLYLLRLFGNRRR